MISVLVETTTEIQRAGFGVEAAFGPLANVDFGFQPIPMGAPGAGGPEGFRAAFSGIEEDTETIVVRAEIETPELAEELAAQPNVVAVWADPKVEPIVDCDPATPKGDGSTVATALRADAVWADAGKSGDGVIVGVLDGGVDGSKYPVAGGWSPVASSPPGDSNVAWQEHGNMCAFDTLVAAPNAQLFDYSIGKTPGGIPALLSAALTSFQHALVSRQDGDPAPAVLTNSWGLYQQSWDPFPPGHPSNYTHNPLHPFNRKVVEVMDEGILVVFAAGNCGSDCPVGRCGPDVGPGQSIRGANGLERVICVGAVNTNDEWIGYSSQGPSTFAREKPDVCGFSHFQGHFPSDTGTSAACPVVAGVMALLISTGKTPDQDNFSQALRSTARQPGAGPWNDQFGYGVVDAEAAYRAL
jgi:subtilisin family serine protease